MAMTVTLGKICTFILRCQIFVLTVEWMGKYSRISWNSRKVLREQISRLLFSLLQEKFLHLKRKLMARNSFHGEQSVFRIYFHSHAFEKSITNYSLWCLIRSIEFLEKWPASTVDGGGMGARPQTGPLAPVGTSRSTAPPTQTSHMWPESPSMAWTSPLRGYVT